MIVAFRSATGRSFVERTTTIPTVLTALLPKKHDAGKMPAS